MYGKIHQNEKDLGSNKIWRVLCSKLFVAHGELEVKMKGVDFIFLSCGIMDSIVELWNHHDEA